MSKKLDEEYKALVASEVPDLWARIDAGLKPKTYSAETSDNVDTGMGDRLIEIATEVGNRTLQVKYLGDGVLHRIFGILHHASAVAGILEQLLAFALQELYQSLL